MPTRERRILRIRIDEGPTTYDERPTTIISDEAYGAPRLHQPQRIHVHDNIRSRNFLFFRMRQHRPQ